MDQRNDILGILSVVLIIAMLAQFGVDYLRTHGLEAKLIRDHVIQGDIPGLGARVMDLLKTVGKPT